MFNMILPSLIITAISLLSFVLPPESGDKTAIRERKIKLDIHSPIFCRNSGAAVHLLLLLHPVQHAADNFRGCAPPRPLLLRLHAHRGRLFVLHCLRAESPLQGHANGPWGGVKTWNLLIFASSSRHAFCCSIGCPGHCASNGLIG